eukprot:gene24274-biopygen22380
MDNRPRTAASFGSTRFVKKLSTLLCSGDDLTRKSSVECGTPEKRCAQSRLGGCGEKSSKMSADKMVLEYSQCFC